MRITYRRQLEPNIQFASLPPHERVGGVAVEWEHDGAQLIGVRFILTGVSLEEDPTGVIITYNDAVMAKVFAAARFIADRIRIQTGFDSLQPFALVGNAPDDIAGESPDEEEYFKRHPKRGQRSISTMMALTRTFDPSQITDFDRLVVPCGHAARGLRTTDPLERYEACFKVLEYFAAKRPNDKPTGSHFDRQLSDVTQKLDPRFDQAKIETLRLLRNRVVHTRADRGHIGPSDIEGIREVQAALPDMEWLVLALLKNPPAFPR
jgi:hypothetical protein